MNSIHIKKIYLFLFYHRCFKCGYEYKKEPMYECSFKSTLEVDTTIEGCANCFDSEEEFKKWTEETGRLYTEETLRGTL